VYEPNASSTEVGSYDFAGMTPNAETKKPVRTITLQLKDLEGTTLQYADVVSNGLIRSHPVTEGNNGEALIVIQTKYPRQYQETTIVLDLIHYDLSWGVWIDINLDGDTTWVVNLPIKRNYATLLIDARTNIGNTSLPYTELTIVDSDTSTTYTTSTWYNEQALVLVPNDDTILYQSNAAVISYNGIEYYLPQQQFHAYYDAPFFGTTVYANAILYNTAEIGGIYVCDHVDEGSQVYDLQYKCETLIDGTTCETIYPLNGWWQPTCSVPLGSRLQMLIYKNVGTSENPVWDTNTVYTFIDYTITSEDVNKPGLTPPTATGGNTIYEEVLDNYWSVNPQPVWKWRSSIDINTVTSSQEVRPYVKIYEDISGINSQIKLEFVNPCRYDTMTMIKDQTTTTGIGPLQSVSEYYTSMSADDVNILWINQHYSFSYTAPSWIEYATNIVITSVYVNTYPNRHPVISTLEYDANNIEHVHLTIQNNTPDTLKVSFIDQDDVYIDSNSGYYYVSGQLPHDYTYYDNEQALLEILTFTCNYTVLAEDMSIASVTSSDGYHPFIRTVRDDHFNEGLNLEVVRNDSTTQSLIVRDLLDDSWSVTISPQSWNDGWTATTLEHSPDYYSTEAHLLEKYSFTFEN
jgi:hypothetical protein